MKSELVQWAKQIKKISSKNTDVYYIFDNNFGNLTVTPYLKKNGRLVKIYDFKEITHENDQFIFNLLKNKDSVCLHKAFNLMIETEKSYWKSIDNPSLQLGDILDVKFEWNVLVNGNQVPQLTADNVTIFTKPIPWYINFSDMTCNTIKHELDTKILTKLLEIPAISSHDVKETIDILSNFNIPLPYVKYSRPQFIEPKPVIIFTNNSNTDEFDSDSDHLELHYKYKTCQIRQDYPFDIIHVLDNKSIIRYNRDRNYELEVFKFLTTCKLKYRQYNNSFILNKITWDVFINTYVPIFKQRGYEIIFDPSFTSQVYTVDDINADVDVINDWFSMSLWIDINGQKVSLLPILSNLLSQLKGETDLKTLTKTDMITVKTADLTVSLPVDKLQPIINNIIEIFNPNMSDDNLLISPSTLISVKDIEKMLNVRYPNNNILEMLQNLTLDFNSLPEITLPSTFTGNLRQYQHDGVKWLQHLRVNNLNGILADDMGLGKTISTLAHILIEKANNRIDNPILVVGPTSIVHNWSKEISKFTKDLNVYVHHGADRLSPEYFKMLATESNVEVIITSYPILQRDGDYFKEIDWYMVILDEAQYIKNFRAKITRVCFQLKAKHRLCMTGTPIENGLYELWSLFSFLTPGLIGNYKNFTETFKKPIDNGNLIAQKTLAKRLKPYILRRTKSEVVHDLPEKTIIEQYIDLEDDQRELYETVRLTMNNHIRELLKTNSVDDIRFEILKILMKLRQVCCDPRLISQGKDVKRSCKLEYVLDMINGMIKDGRKILLFSQFTSMLDILKTELEKLGIMYVELRGDTKNRMEVVDKFQAGSVPLFLISLKAGGIGLNLTAADTVIHYDQWWNPAVENQATDRAYRIGQDKPVFVYKLIASETIEEKILKLHEKKNKIANSIYDDDVNEIITNKLTNEDIEMLIS